MRISRISKIRGNRVFHDFRWQSNLPDFGQFNLIYGWNGSGKTTISSLFENLQNRQPPSAGEVEIKLDNGSVISGSEFSNPNNPSVRVFNRDFVAETVAAIGEGQVQPIYYLGKENIEKQKQVEGFLAELETAKTAMSEAEDEKERTGKILDDFCISQARIIKEALLGSAEHANYNKGRFRQAIEKLQAMCPQPKLLSDDEKDSLRRQKDAQPKANIPNIALQKTGSPEFGSRVSRLLRKTVVSQVLDELSEAPEIAPWVQRGLVLHTGDHQSDLCRFCGNEFSLARRSQLEGHFNDALNAFQDEVDLLVSQIEESRNIVKGISLPIPSLFYDQMSETASTALAAVEPAINSSVEILDSFREALKQKRSKPFQVQTLEIEKPEETAIFGQVRDAVGKVNSIISEHNEATANLTEKKRQACQALEQHYVLEATTEFNKLDSGLSVANDAHDDAKGKPVELQRKIEDVERDIVEHRLPAEELTSELRSYLGRDELKFDVEMTGYALTRGGEPAQHLSEGERTAIAFLYFLKSLKDKDFDLAHGVVVIDDPVSSLDANALFSAFGHMKDRTAKSHQLSILTHNFAFFRQVKYWFNHLRGQKKRNIEIRPAQFYLLRSKTSDGVRNAVLGPMDSLLLKFESEYHYLFRQVYDVANLAEDIGDLAEYYGMPNIGRRLIETFLAYRFPDRTDGLYKLFELVEFDLDKKNRILRFLHTYSHSGGISEPEHEPTMLSETKQVMSEILELVRVSDKAHYEGMMRLLQEAEEEG